MEINHKKKTKFIRGIKTVEVRFGKPDIHELIILFGYMSSGKTEYAYSVARRNVEAGNAVCFISLELPEFDMKLRIARKKASVKKIDFQLGNYSEKQKEIMDSEFKKIEEMEGLSIVSLEEKYMKGIEHTIREHYDHGYRMFIIDNLDKIGGDDNDNRRYQVITSILQDIKNELPICIILIHHAKKPDSKMVYSRAGMSGMRGSQKIMDNATQVFEIFRDLDPDLPNEERDRVEIIQLKDTFEGANGAVEIYFYKGDYYPDRQHLLPF